MRNGITNQLLESWLLEHYRFQLEVSDAITIAPIPISHNIIRIRLLLINITQKLVRIKIIN